MFLKFGIEYYYHVTADVGFKYFKLNTYTITKSEFVLYYDFSITVNRLFTDIAWFVSIAKEVP